jgi:CHAD domain-containing protein
MREVLEREDKWDVDERFKLPDVGGIVAGGRVEHDTVDLTSEYYDTAEGDLRAHGIVLRRRDGGDDAGWQLKTPTTGGRTELQWPPTDAPPASLTELLTGISLGKQVTSVARIHTVRNRYRIRLKLGELYAEVADDSVRASANERLLAWREIEVELGPGTRSMPKRLTDRLRSAGARPSRYPSKLSHVLPPTPIAEPESRAAGALARYLGTQIDAIVAGDMGLRRGRDPIHDTRVAIRRLRSMLRVFGSVLDRSSIGDLDGELRWFAALLGDVRDCQVQHRRFTGMLDELADELILGPVRSRIRNDVQGTELSRQACLREAMDSPRYLAIMAVLRNWRTDPPVGAETKRAGLIRRARRVGRKADRRLTAALTDGDDAMLHRARKAAKRARYAAELCQPVGGAKHPKRMIKHYKRVQSVLGDHQDAVVASAALRRMALAAGTTVGENGFTYGLLFAREQQIAEECRRKARNLVCRTRTGRRL